MTSTRLDQGRHYVLTLKVPITSVADDNFFDIFPYFRQK